MTKASSTDRACVMSPGSSGDVTAYQPFPAGRKTNTSFPSLTVYCLGMAELLPPAIDRRLANLLGGVACGVCRWLKRLVEANAVAEGVDDLHALRAPRSVLHPRPHEPIPLGTDLPVELVEALHPD